MKLNPTSTRQPTSDAHPYKPWKHPWHSESERLKKPIPPTQAAIEKAQFVDKTYQWKAK